MSHYGRNLIRLRVRKRLSEALQVDYTFEVRELVSGGGESSGQLAEFWMLILDNCDKCQRAAVPIELCGPLLDYLLSCRVAEPPRDHEGEASREESCFELSRLSSLDIKTENFCLFIEPSKGETSPVEARCLLKSQPTVAEETGEEKSKETTRFRQAWEEECSIQLYQVILPDLAAFLTDVTMRYRSLDAYPRVPSLYSPSGDRRFTFNLRKTRWGQRLHITQLTELHRTVIGVPLDSLVPFRDRLSSLIEALQLEERQGIKEGLSKYSAVPLPARTRYNTRGITRNPVEPPHEAPSLRSGEQLQGMISKRGRRLWRAPRRQQALKVPPEDPVKADNN